MAGGTANVDGNLLDITRLVFENLPQRHKSIISHSSPILPHARNRHSEAGLSRKRVRREKLFLMGILRVFVCAVDFRKSLRVCHLGTKSWNIILE